MRKKRVWVLFISSWLLAVVAVNQYFFCPQYNFETSLPFSGPGIYNPYEDADFSHWHKCNFHTHVRSWLDIPPRTGTAADAWNIYRKLGYDVHCISNYQCVDDYHHEDSNYLEAYEHGYGILKNHQNVLGTKEVVWKDYVLPQTLANKQHILSTLRKNDSAVIIINHPAHHNAYHPDDFSFLSGNDCLELFPSGSLGAWDSALSAGRRVFAIADDDTHDITNPATT